MKVNTDNTLHFNPKEWSNTDPYQYQFCKNISEHEFTYIQLKPSAIIRFSNIAHNNKHALACLNDKTALKDWYYDTIDINDYTQSEIDEYLSPYGGILDNINDNTARNQLIAECIFETDCCFY